MWLYCCPCTGVGQQCLTQELHCVTAFWPAHRFSHSSVTAFWPAHRFSHSRITLCNSVFTCPLVRSPKNYTVEQHFHLPSGLVSRPPGLDPWTTSWKYVNMVLNVHRNQLHHVTAFSSLYWLKPVSSTSCDSTVILIPVDFSVGPKNDTMWSCFTLVTGSDRQGHVASLSSSYLSLSAALGPKTAVFDYCVVILMLVQN